MADKLNLMDSFPSIELTPVGGGTLRLPEEIGADYGIVLFYRGHW